MDRQAADEVIRIHLTGCSASCAQPQIADIGLRGETAHLADGTLVEAVDVGLGGSLGTDASFIDLVEGAKRCDETPEAIVRLVETYRAPTLRWRTLLREGPPHPQRPPPTGRTGSARTRSLMAGFAIRDEMNGIAEAPGKVWFWQLAEAVDQGEPLRAGVEASHRMPASYFNPCRE